MRRDPVQQHTTHQEGAKDQAKDLEAMNQPVKKANQPYEQREKNEAGQGKVRAQDPNFGRGHH